MGLISWLHLGLLPLNQHPKALGTPRFNSPSTQVPGKSVAWMINDADSQSCWSQMPRSTQRHFIGHPLLGTAVFVRVLPLLGSPSLLSSGQLGMDFRETQSKANSQAGM